MDEINNVENQELEEVKNEDCEIVIGDETEEYTPSVIESITTLAVLVAPLAVSYVAGVVTAEPVKNTVAQIKEKLRIRKEARKAKIEELKAKRARAKITEVDDEEENN